MVIGQRLSHYEVIESLGAGGMGEVYRARDTRLGRDVAIKVLSPHRPFSATARLRFQREASTASALNHPNIITIYEVNSEGNVDFIVMEYVRGSALDSVLKSEPSHHSTDSALLHSDRRRGGKGAQRWDCSSRPQAGQRHDYRRWINQGARFRTG